MTKIKKCKKDLWKIENNNYLGNKKRSSKIKNIISIDVCFFTLFFYYRFDLKV